MKWFRRRDNNDDTAHVDAAQTWVRGQELSGRLFRAVLWFLVACGPIALGLTVVMRGANATPPPPPVMPAQPNLDARQTAAETAERFTAAYLTAKPGDVVPGLGKIDHAPAMLVTDVGTATVDTGGTPEQFAVTVGVTVATPDEKGEVAGMSRRYFQVLVDVVDPGAVQLLGLPAEVAAPRVEMAERAGYSVNVSPADPVGVAAQEFLSALLTGSADVTRFTAPSSTIRAVSPPSLKKVRVDQISAQALPGVAGEGVQTVIAVKATGDERLRLEYFLEMQVRASRWEVTRILTHPTPTPISGSVPESSPGVATPTESKEK